MLVEEVSTFARRNRTPMIFWSIVILAPALLIGLGFAVWLAFGGKQSLVADSAADIPAKVTDRTWSFYQAFECIQAHCADEKSAKAFIESGSAATVNVTGAVTESTYTIAALDDQQWTELANAITADGSIRLDDVVSSVQDGGSNSGVFTVGSISEAFTFSTGKTSTLTGIEIGGSR
ncbi:hypothetical protein GCM10025867_46820 (plasmid) [Frondihabitans sucicola]|uniref:Uncharacterized protein n=1 Tax=Frondihabitans sucicola TaxID=1268041 RepID=A0ABN6Y8X3_9MICO|nr:hypothetical protein [Frondihabitans sucicola]BDZ52441.1 hypothetical protein GCM10025867_46820 [Frondihabitans sucicola]